MAPALHHPPGVTFIDDERPINVNIDAAEYYGGKEVFSRGRTYSAVSHATRRFRAVLMALSCSRLHKDMRQDVHQHLESACAGCHTTKRL